MKEAVLSERELILLIKLVNATNGLPATEINDRDSLKSLINRGLVNHSDDTFNKTTQGALLVATLTCEYLRSIIEQVKLRDERQMELEIADSEPETIGVITIEKQEISTVTYALSIEEFIDDEVVEVRRNFFDPQIYSFFINDGRNLGRTKVLEVKTDLNLPYFDKHCIDWDITRDKYISLLKYNVNKPTN